MTQLIQKARTLREGTEAHFSIPSLLSLNGLCREPEIVNYFVLHLAKQTLDKFDHAPCPYRQMI